MIRLHKSGIPEVLKKNASAWTAELLSSSDPKKALSSRYGHQEIKNALIAETSGKCAYCESKIRHVSYGDVEHITAKSDVPGLAYEWSNLTLACDVCNTKKSNTPGLIDPYRDDPTTCFVIAGAWIGAAAGSVAAQLTVAVLELGRLPLLERRNERITSVHNQVVALLATKDEAARAILLKALIDDVTADSAEYSAFCTAHVAALRSSGQLPI